MTEISAKSSVWEFVVSFPSERLPEMECQGGYSDPGAKGIYFYVSAGKMVPTVFDLQESLFIPMIKG